MLNSRRTTRAAGQFGIQAEPGVEEDDPDGDRDHGGDQILSQQGVGVEGADRAGAEPEREQQQDRWEPEDLGDQRRRRRQDHHQPELEERPRLAERRHRQCEVSIIGSVLSRARPLGPGRGGRADSGTRSCP